MNRKMKDMKIDTDKFNVLQERYRELNVQLVSGWRTLSTRQYSVLMKEINEIRVVIAEIQPRVVA